MRAGDDGFNAFLTSRVLLPVFGFRSNTASVSYSAAVMDGVPPFPTFDIMSRVFASFLLFPLLPALFLTYFSLVGSFDVVKMD